MDYLAVQKRTGRVSHSVTPPKGKHKRKRAYVPRRTRRFQLRNGHPDDMHVAEVLDYARTQRQEVTIIRNGVALEYSLQRGDLSILLERYPWITAAIKAMAGGGGDELSEIKAMLEMVMAQQKANGGYTLASEPVAAKPVLKQAALAMPVYEDDDLPAIAVRTDTSNNASLNFMKGLGQIQ